MEDIEVNKCQESPMIRHGRIQSCKGKIRVRGTSVKDDSAECTLGWKDDPQLFQPLR